MFYCKLWRLVQLFLWGHILHYGMIYSTFLPGVNFYLLFTFFDTTLQEKRFHNWLENARDWAVSRSRFWGTPLPVWTSEDGQETVVIGSVEELEKLSGIEVCCFACYFNLCSPNFQFFGITSLYFSSESVKDYEAVVFCKFLRHFLVK